MGVSGTDLQAIPGATQFQVRVHDAMLYVPYGGSLIEAGCSTEAQWADGGSHVGRLAMERSQAAALK
eukprot:6066052-Alexandrium_andersonii.AAC.1